MKKAMPTKNVRRQQALLLLPLFMIPLLTLGFWALGGGRHLAAKQTAATGLNLELPPAALKSGTTEDKLRFYEQATEDSVKRSVQNRNDPLYQMAFEADMSMALPTRTAPNNPAPAQAANDPNEEQVYRKLAELNQQLQETTHTPTPSGEELSRGNGSSNATRTNNNAVERLEQVLAQNNGRAAKDPELEQLNVLLDKIRDIQQPDNPKALDALATRRINSANPQGSRALQPAITLFDTTGQHYSRSPSFYGVGPAGLAATQNAVQAVVHQTQVLATGAIIKLRLLEPLALGNLQLPPGLFLYGTTSFSGERLFVSITTLQYHRSLFTVQLDAYDLDGVAGIYVPGIHSTSPDLQTATNSLQALHLGDLDPTLKGKAVSTGLEAVKTLLHKNKKATNVTVPGGYRLLLKSKTV